MTDTMGFEAGDDIIVTGAGSGIGRATAMLAAQVGLHVMAWDIIGETAEATAAATGGTAYTVDVSDPAQVQAAFEHLDRPARYLVNNAGPPSGDPTPFAEGLYLGVGSMQVMTDAWLATDLPERAAMVNIASVAGTTIGSYPDWYCATKAAVAGYTKHLGIAYPTRMRANAIAPGMIATPRSLRFADSPQLAKALERNPMGRMGEPEEIGWAVLFLLSPRASYITGTLLTVDGGWTVSP